MSWQDVLASGGTVILDGATGTELARRGVALDPAAWSGAAALTHAGTLAAVHRDYVDAGAGVIFANTFGSARFVLAAAGLGEHWQDAVDRAVATARHAAGAAAVAGVISNLPPGFDVTGYPSPGAELADYRALARRLAAAGVDLIALEMMEETRHAPRAVMAAVETGLPVWLGVSCRTGEGSLVSYDFPDVAFADVLDALLAFAPAVVNVMHTPVDAIDEAVREVRRRFDGPIGVYPELDRATAPAALADHAVRWHSLGVRLFGGCCGSTPAHIAALAAALGQS